MASEQAHGDDFEHIVIARSGLRLPDSGKAPAGSIHDIPAQDTPDAIPVSIKTAQSDLNAPGNRPTIGLADAQRFYRASTCEPLRMVVGIHHTTASGPIVYEVHECVIVPHMHAGLWGEIGEEDVRTFARRIKEWAAQDDRDGIVGRKRACDHARKLKRALMPCMGHVDLSPKISANEARLQCSIPVYTLRRECLNAGSEATIHSILMGHQQWRALPLPIALRAGNRAEKKQAAG